MCAHVRTHTGQKMKPRENDIRKTNRGTLVATGIWGCGVLDFLITYEQVLYGRKPSQWGKPATLSLRLVSPDRSCSEA